MKIINQKLKRKLFLVAIVGILCFNFLVLSNTLNQQSTNSSINSLNSKEGNADGTPRTSASTSYSLSPVDNTDFSTGINPWSNQTTGDSTDLIPNYSGESANIIVNGSAITKKIDEPLRNSVLWTKTKNPEFPTYPDNANVDGDGFHVDHTWDENVNQTRNTPSVWWKQDITMDVDMTDYNITSISLEVDFNATVDVERLYRAGDMNTDYEGAIDRPGDAYQDSMNVGDFAKFYVLIQDVEGNYQPTIVALNSTADSNLGRDAGSISFITGPLTSYLPSVISNAMISAFLVNPYKFSIILGIDIYCEDNESGVDVDDWDDLIFKTFNLTFTYEKYINYQTSLSWNHVSDMINHTSVAYYSHTVIDSARLNYKYAINNTWSPDSFNSEIEFKVDGITQTEYPNIKLRSYNYTIEQGGFLEARSGGYDVTDYIPVEKDILLTIKVTMLDKFDLGYDINISIDDVYFVISYTVYTNPPAPAAAGDDDDDDGKDTTTIIEEPWFNMFIAIAAISGGICLAGYLVYYVKVLKYPKPVRKVRKFRKTLKRKSQPDTPIFGREAAFKAQYKVKTDFFTKYKGKGSEKVLAKGKKLPEKISSEKINRLIGKTEK